MAQAEWKFSPRVFNDVEQEVTEADQFDTEAIPKPVSLVREALQNSQDASDGGSGPVRVKISWVDEAGGLDLSFLKQITDPLRPHLEASGFNANQQIRSALVFEDFGTRGLTGSYLDDLDRGNFRSFWFRHGGSDKGGGKLGRWGLGKLVFPMFSAMRCFFALTIRQDDGKSLVMGQAVLKTHSIGSGKLAPHGHYGVLSDKKLLPIQDAETCEKFRAAFQLHRSTEPGLSVIIPQPGSRPSSDQLVRFVVENYAYPIIAGRLIVEVFGTVIDAAAVRALGEKYLKPGLIEFIEEVHAFGREELMHVSPQKTGNGSYEFSEGCLGGRIAQLRTSLNQGRMVAFRVPVSILGVKATKPDATHVDIFFRAAGADQEGHPLYVRGGITVPSEAESRFPNRNAFVLLLAEESAIASFLGDAENPAHTSWSSTTRLKAQWKSPGQTLHMIRTAPAQLYRLLASGAEQEAPNALLDYFWIPDPDQRSKQRGPRASKKPARDSAGPVAEIPSNAPTFAIARQSGGFALSQGRGFGRLVLPARAIVKVAYDLEEGNALKAWDEWDFNLSKDPEISVKCAGGEVDCDGNEIELDILSEDFLLTVCGFDPRRDLVVDVRVVAATANA